MIHNMPENIKHVPFIRHDQYGEGGTALQPFTEKLRLMVMAFTILPLRILSAFGCVVSYYLVIRVATAIPNDVWVRKFAAFTGKFYSRACLFCLGFLWIKWHVVGRDTSQQQQEQQQQKKKQHYVALVSNHVGWADILVHMARFFPAFVAREGTQNLRFVGLISRRMGCLYVDREKKGASTNNLTSATANPVSSINGANQGVAGAVKQRMLMAAAHPELALRPMLLFPEGTTSNGSCLLPFKTGAFLAGLPVLPVVLKYAGTRRGARASPAWESIGAPPHLLLVMCEPWHTLDAYQLPPYHPSPKEVADPRLYADNVRAYMLKYSSLQPSDATLEDKRDYQAQLKARQQKQQQQGSTGAADKRGWRVASGVAAVVAAVAWWGAAQLVGWVALQVRGMGA